MEFLRRELSTRLGGAALLEVWSPGQEKFAGPTEISLGSFVSAVLRRGKFLVIEFSSGQDLVVHLGMTGSLLWNSRRARHTRAQMTFSSGTLTFNDPRGFGRALAGPRGTQVGSPTLRSLGPDPLDTNLRRKEVASVLRGMSGTVKARLLSQRVLAGIGNYMADESCFRARIAPHRRELDRSEALTVVEEVVKVARESLAAGGVSQRDYVHLDGSTGRYQDLLQCYGRSGLPCLGCGTALVKTVVAGRSSTWCAFCQS